MPPQPPPPLPSMIYQFADLYNTYVLPYLPDSIQSLSNVISSFLTSILSAASNGDMVSLAAFLLTVYLTLKIADYIRRSVIGWVIFLIKIGLVLGMVNAVFYVNRYGLQKALCDAEYIFGFIWGFIWGFVEDKVVGNTDGKDNRTGWSGGNRGYGGRDNSWGAYSGGRQQVPVGEAGRKGGVGMDGRERGRGLALHY